MNENISIVEIQEQWNDIVTMLLENGGHANEAHTRYAQLLYACTPPNVNSLFQMGRLFEI